LAGILLTIASFGGGCSAGAYQQIVKKYPKKFIGADGRLALQDTTRSVCRPNMDVEIRGCFFKVDKSEMVNGVSVSASDSALRVTTRQDNPKNLSTKQSSSR
jgi:hypothetical protein